MVAISLSRGIAMVFAKSSLLWAAVGSIAAATADGDAYFNALDWVDPLIGTGKDGTCILDGLITDFEKLTMTGHVFGGASLPYGMAKAVSDTDSDDNQGGFVAGDPRVSVTGFSSMHDSGTGGSPSLGNFALFPYNGCPGDDINRCVYPKNSRKIKYLNDTIVAEPGYFSLTLSSRVTAEMTTSQHASLFQFSFPEGSTANPLILLDLTDLSNSRQDNATISVDPKTGRMTGSARFIPSFGSGTYTAYFCADFSGATIKDTGIFADSRASSAVQNLTISRSINGYPLPGGGWIRFQTPPNHSVLARMGVSLISSSRACSSAESEIPNFDFDGLRSAATEAWRRKLAPIQVSRNGLKNLDLVKNFYSGIYRTMINPQDYTGENPLWKSDKPYFDSFYCLWDSFRSQIPFLLILDPKQVARMVESLIDTYVHDGWMPDCRMSLSRGFTQGGSNADVVLADAFVKGLRENIDWNLGYAAVVKDAEVEPYDWCCHGRGGLDSWNEVGYIPVQDFDYKGFGTLTRSVSRTLEYSYNDFTVAQIAKGLPGKEAEVEKYQDRSNNWANLFRSGQKSFNNGQDTGFEGFFQPKYRNRTWGYQNPLTCSNIDTNGSTCSLQNNAAETFESSIWEYSFFVPHDQASLMTLLGGPSAFVKRLDYLHDQNITLISNEPSFLTVFQYHYAGRPALSAKRAHYYIPSQFSPTVIGLPGNDDSGAMGSFLAFSMMGLFPNPGQNVYLIMPPFFESVSIKSPITNQTARISISNFDPDYQNIYIQSATLNGEPYHKNWIDHSFFLEGKKLVLTVGRNESSWGTRLEDLPYSLGAYSGFSGTTLRRTSRNGPRRYDPLSGPGANLASIGIPLGV